MPPTPALRRLLMLYAGLIAANVAVWLWALVVLRDHPLLLGTAAIAYGLGLRHAVDADHIAAIDVATRKLMQEGQRPVSVGLFFSLGHSTIVIAATLGIALTAFALRDRFDAFREIGGTIGTAVSATFLLVLACVNLMILRDVCGVIAAPPDTRTTPRTCTALPGSSRGCCARCSGSCRRAGTCIRSACCSG